MNKPLLILALLSASAPLFAQVPTSTATSTPTTTPSSACCQGVTQLTGFLAPAGMAIDYPNKRLYVADFSNQQVEVFNSDNENAITILNSANSGVSIAKPLDVAVDGNGDLFIADFGAPQPLKIFNSNFTFLGSIGPAGVTANGVWADTSTVYFSTENSQVLEYSGSTTVYSATATYGGSPGVLNSPNEMVKIGNWLYVADTYNFQIVKFNTSPFNSTPVTVLTGLLYPSGLRTDPAGNIYVVEGNNGAAPEYLDEFSPDFSVEKQCPFPALGIWGAAVNDLGEPYVSLINGISVTLLQGCGTSALATATPTFTQNTPTSTATSTPSSTATKTPTGTPTKTLTLSPTNTPTSTLTVTLTATPTPTPSHTPTALPNAPPDGSCDQSYAYPNPVSGNSMKIHLHLCEAAQTTVLIYNTAGELVAQASNPAVSGPNDFNLQVPGLAFGIYYYIIRVDAASGSRRLKPQKFAVTH